MISEVLRPIVSQEPVRERRGSVMNDPTEIRLGFVGLGIMGTPMASLLIDHGVPLGVFDTDFAALRSLAAKGAEPYTSPS